MNNDPTSCLLGQFSRESCMVIMVVRQKQILNFRYIYPKRGGGFLELGEVTRIRGVYEQVALSALEQIALREAKFQALNYRARRHNLSFSVSSYHRDKPTNDLRFSRAAKLQSAPS